MVKTKLILDFLINVYKFELDHFDDECTYLRSLSLYLKLFNDLTNFELLPNCTNVKNKELEKKRDKLIKTHGDIMFSMKLLIEWYDDIEENLPITTMWKDELSKPLPEDIKVDLNRDLRIYVWGRKKRKFLAEKVDHNFNAAVLYGKKTGVNWKLDGRSEEIQIAVMKCPMFHSFMKIMLETIESKNCKKIGINCRAGRHRSVTCAIMLSKYYPKTIIYYLEL